MKGSDQRASHLAPTNAASLHQAGQSHFHARQLRQLPSDLDKFCFCKGACLLALGTILKSQKLPDFIQAEPHTLRGLDKAQPFNVGSAIAADAPGLPRWLGQQPLALIEPDRFHTDAGKGTKLANGQVIVVQVHSMLCS